MCRVVCSSSASGRLSQLHVCLRVIGRLGPGALHPLAHQVLEHIDQGLTRFPDGQQCCNDCGDEPPDEGQNHPESEITCKQNKYHFERLVIDQKGYAAERGRLRGLCSKCCVTGETLRCTFIYPLLVRLKSGKSVDMRLGEPSLNYTASTLQ